MDNIIVGHTDEDGYELFGKLADGTPIYKSAPVPLPDPQILKEDKERRKKIITDYNDSVEINEYDTSLFLNTFQKEEEVNTQKEQAKKGIKEKHELQLIEEEQEPEISSSDSSVLDYYKPNTDKEDIIEEVEDTNTTDYLDLFVKQTEDEEAQEEKISQLREARQAKIDKINEERERSAEKYNKLIE
mgnify:CR=1 FL=1